MAMTKKFALFNLDDGGFLKADGTCAENEKLDLLSGAIFTEETAKEKGIDLDENKYLAIPMSQATLDGLPDLDIMEDTAPDVPFGDVDPEAKAEALKESFAVLSPYGFYDEKIVFAGTENEYSHAKVRGYALDYANLYTMEDLNKTGQAWIADEPDVIIPISESQQEKLKQLPEFSPEMEPHGFFMKPVGGYQDVSAQKTDMPDLGDALDALEADSKDQGIEQ